MQRTAATVVTVVLAMTTLAACGGQSAYCEAVEKNTKTLNAFGKTRTTEAYTGYAKTFRTVAKSAPTAVEDDWTALAKATDGVLAAQEEVGLGLEDMTDTAKVKELDSDELATLNKAYEAFNGTTDQRTAVVKNVKQECKITLK